MIRLKNIEEPYPLAGAAARRGTPVWGLGAGAVHLPTTLVAGNTVAIDLAGCTFHGVTDNFVTKVATDGSSLNVGR